MLGLRGATMMEEIDHDTVRSMSDAELADRYDAVTGQISDLYTARRPIEAEIRARMDDQGTVRLKGEESEVKLSSEQGRELSPTMQLSIAEAMVKALAKMKQEMEFNSQPKLIVSKRNKGKGANINEKSK